MIFIVAKAQWIKLIVIVLLLYAAFNYYMCFNYASLLLGILSYAYKIYICLCIRAYKYTVL